MQLKNIGIIYFATGEKHINEAIFSAKSFKRHHRNLPITLFTTIIISPKIKCFDNIITIDNKIKHQHPYSQKVACIIKSPYKQTLFLDTDTLILKNFNNIFSELTKHDIMIANAPHVNWELPKPKLISCILPKEYNTGVIFINKEKEKTNLFIDEWYKECLKIEENFKLGVGDQNVFNTLINKKQFKDLKLNIIDNKKYNARDTMLGYLIENNFFSKISIIHCHGLNTLSSRINIFILKWKSFLKLV